MGIFCNGNDWITSTTDYVRPSTNHTVSYWLRLDNSGSTRRPFGTLTGWESRTSGTTLISDYLELGTLGTVTLTVGTYHHVAFVQNVSGSQRLAFLDGVLVDTVNSASFAGQQVGTIKIGVSPGGGGGVGTQGWFGAIDDIRVYNRALTVEETETIYTCRGTDGLIEDLDLWYPMDEGSEGATVSTIYEVTGNGPNCTNVNNTPVYNYDAGIRVRRVA